MIAKRTTGARRVGMGPMWALWLPFALAAAPAGAARQSLWQLPPQRYQVMNTFERAQYDKAAKLFREGSYKAAAAEFEKFNVQFQDSENISFMLLLRGRSLHLAKKRNTAIKVYNEVLDYFREDVSAAAPALYYKGLARTENGEVAKGLACLRELADDAKLNKHALAAGALRRVADHYWTQGKPELAVRYWKQTCRDFQRTNRHEAGAARRNVTAYYVMRADYTGYERWLVGEKDAENARHRRSVAQNALSAGQHGFNPQWSAHAQKKDAAQVKKDMGALHTYYKSRKTWFAKTRGLWEYHTSALSFAAGRLKDKKETNKLVNETVAYIQSIKEKSDRDAKFSWMVDQLIGLKDMLRARHCISKITDRYLAAYKDYEVTGHGEGKWKEAVARLKNLESMGDATWRAKAETTRAWIYKDKLRDYEKAIKLYQQISKPPGTLWSIQECYHRWGKLTEALSMLTEIENSFPDEAARAVWRKAEYLHRAGQKKLAVAMARKVMKVYPKSPESSRAHQLLERYKIATGGGLIDED